MCVHQVQGKRGGYNAEYHERVETEEDVAETCAILASGNLDAMNGTHRSMKGI